MSFVRYTAERSLIVASPTRQGQSFDLDLTLNDLQPARTVNRRENISLSGDQETIRFRGAQTWQASTTPIARGTTAFDQIREFLDSVEGGEAFEFDPYGGSTDSPDDLRNVRITSRGYSEARVVRQGDGGGVDSFAWTFAMREF